MAGSLSSLLPEIVRLSHMAGEAILEVYRREDFGTRAKADQSPLTDADMAAHDCILRGLKDLTPDIPILSEESAESETSDRFSWQRFWLVDPLDGTKEFVNRNDQFTVNIALVENGIPVLGVLHAPALGLTYSAAHKMGAFKQDFKAHPGKDSQDVPLIRIRVQGQIKEPLHVAASRSHSNAQTAEFFEQLGEEWEEIKVIPVGSALKFGLVAEGIAHLYPRFGPTMEWDTAAPQCIVEQAGGVVVTWAGKPLRYNKPNLLNPYFLAACKPLSAFRVGIPAGADGA
ncbi:MAG: 3'(2'),5'-bisphosphate nucleotidase CysQ [Cyanophyceae cyanobacterium]